MHKSTATHCFIESCYGTLEDLHQALKTDWWEVQATWETFMDGLCRDGLITIEQYESWMFPWAR
jgi:hypothetical protein